MLVHIWCAPTWHFHTELCKFLRNISPNICGLGERTGLKLGEVSSLFIFNTFTISWLNPLNGFWFIFLLRDSENDLYLHFKWHAFPCRWSSSGTNVAEASLSALSRHVEIDIIMGNSLVRIYSWPPSIRSMKLPVKMLIFKKNLGISEINKERFLISKYI